MKDVDTESVHTQRIRDTVDIYTFGSTQELINTQLKLTSTGCNIQTSTVTIYIATCKDTGGVLELVQKHTTCLTPLLLLVQTNQSPRTACTIPEGIRHAFTNEETFVDDLNDLLERYAMDVTFRMTKVLQEIRGVILQDPNRRDTMPVILKSLHLSLDKEKGRFYCSTTIREIICNAV